MTGEWDQRELCSDGACTGLIGNDGLCKVCGRAAANWGDERRRGMTPLPPDGFDDDDDEPQDEAPGDYAALADPPEDEEWDARKLCPDGGCTGLLGDDGHCKVCGRTAEAS